MPATTAFRCLVPSCKKVQANFPNKKFYVLPPKGALRDAWLEAVNVPDLDKSAIAPCSRHFRVCQDHFQGSDFERDLKTELLGLKKPKKLKPNAVPSVCLEAPPLADPEDGSSEEGGIEDDTVSVKMEVEPGDDLEYALKTEVETRKTKTLRKSKKKRRPIKRIAKPQVPKLSCLICSNSRIDKNCTKKFNHPGANNCDSLNKQLWNIFVLEKVLKISSLRCQQILRKFGKDAHPEDWFHLCSRCSIDIAKAMEYYQEIVKLQVQLDTVCERLNRKAKETVDLGKDVTKSGIEIELWAAIRDRNGIGIPADLIKEEEERIAEEEEEQEEEPVDLPHYPSDHESSPPPISDPLVLTHDDMAARIDHLLRQNEIIVGEPVVRPKGFSFGFDSDSSSSDVDEDVKKIKKRLFVSQKLKRVSRPTPDPVTKERSATLVKAAKLLIRTKLQGTKLNCPLCPAVYCTKELLHQHSLDHETTVNSVNSVNSNCQFCGLLVKNDRLLQQHLQFRHGYPDNRSENSTEFKKFPSGDIHSTVECPFCIAQFSHLMQYETHLTLHEINAESQPELNCPYTHCCFPFDSEKSLAHHLRHFHDGKTPEMNTCETCGFTISKVLKETWRAHLLKHTLEEARTTESGDLGCPMCEQNFHTKMSLIYHKRKVHVNELGTESYLCVHCPRLFLSKSGLDNHVSSAHGEGNDCINQCEHCGKVYRTRKLLASHIKKAHNSKPATQPESYVCEHCGGVYKSLANLRDHKKLFYGEGLKKAELTSNRFNQRFRATSRNPQECQYCHVTLPHLPALKRHIRTHATIKCDTCDKLFMNQSTLERHKIMVHKTPDSSTKRNCQYCGKEFKHRRYIYGHYKYCKSYMEKKNAEEASGANTIKCTNCKKTFMKQQAFGGHLPHCKKMYGGTVNKSSLVESAAATKKQNSEKLLNSNE